MGEGEGGFVNVPTFVSVGGWVAGCVCFLPIKRQYFMLPIKLQYFKRRFQKIVVGGCAWVAVGDFPKTSSDRVHFSTTSIVGSKFSNKVNYNVTTHTDIPHYHSCGTTKENKISTVRVVTL